MNENLVEKDIKYDYDMAIKIAKETFEKKHPKELQPKWLEKCMSIDGNRDENNNWKVKITLLPKTIKPNFHWKWRSGSLILVEVDSITGIEYIVISDGPEEAIEVIFKVEVDLAMSLTKILVDTDLNTLDWTKYIEKR
jgi:hypothetical protein